MRISDWRSDVCSSDLARDRLRQQAPLEKLDTTLPVRSARRLPPSFQAAELAKGSPTGVAISSIKRLGHTPLSIARVVSRTLLPQTLCQRSEERRVGKECVSTCSSRWSPYH